MSEQDQLAGAENPAQESEVVDQTIATPGAADTPETVAESDEAKNARELSEQRERSEKKARGVQKRLDELTADKYAERAAREAAERRADELARRFQEFQQRGPQAQSAQEPRREDFSDYEQYIRAVARHDAQQHADRLVQERLTQQQQQWQQQAQAREAERQAADLQRDLSQKQQAYAKIHPDYFDVVNNEDIDVPAHAAMAIMRHKDAPALMYQIGQNPALAESLQGLDPMSQVLAVGELAASLKRSPQVSKAPPPGSPVGKPGSGGSGSPRNIDEYYASITRKKGK